MHQKFDSVMRGSPKLMVSEEQRNEEKVEGNLIYQIESGQIRYFHSTRDKILVDLRWGLQKFLPALLQVC